MSGEYGVLDGAKALALPTRLGQSMVVSNTRGSDLIWEAKDAKGKNWFKSNISLYDFSAVRTSDDCVSGKLQKILKECVRQNSEFLSKWNGFKIQTKLDFDRSWGLGSSSSLYCLIAEWAEVNPLLLYFAVEDGSGYDVACGWAEGPLVYTNSPEETSYCEIDFDPSFKDHLFFVHLNRKQNSEEAVADYRKKPMKKSLVNKLTEITDAMIDCGTLKEFEELIAEHENCLSAHLGQGKVKDELFSEYWGQVKSLGAWGGDFVLATSEYDAEETRKYFSHKGYDTFFTYDELILT